MHLALRIENIAEFSSASRANLQARRILAVPGPLNAKVALLHDAAAAGAITEVSHPGIETILGDGWLGEIETPRPIGTGGFAISAPYAPIVINHRNAVRLLPG